MLNLNCSFGFMFAGAWWRNKCFKVLFYGRLWCNQVSSFTSMEDHICALFPCIVSLLFFSLNLLSPKNVSVAIVHHWVVLGSGSTVLAGRLFGIPLRGTHSHAYVSSYMVSKIQFLLLMNKSYYICNNVISLEPYRAQSSLHWLLSPMSYQHWSLNICFLVILALKLWSWWPSSSFNDGYCSIFIFLHNLHLHVHIIFLFS